MQKFFSLRLPLLVLTLGALAAALTALTYTGALAPTLLGDPGAFVRWAQPIWKALTNLSLAIAVGASVFAAFATVEKSAPLNRTLNLVVGSSVAWVFFGSLSLVFTYATIAGKSIDFSPTFSAGLQLFVTSIALGQSLAINLALGVILATLAVMVRSLRNTYLLVAVGFAALIPLAVSGHAAGTANHAMAVNSTGLHLLAIVLWVGGLVALLWAQIGSDQVTGSRLLSRYSSLALGAFALTAVSGLFALLSRIKPTDLLTTDYGQIALAKFGALLLLGALGAFYRTRLFKSEKTKRAFTRLASVELLVMGVAVGLGTALARTGFVGEVGVGEEPTPAELLTGSKLPPELTPSRWITEYKIDLVWLLVVIAAAMFYLWGVIRLKRRGDTWSIARTISWLAGLALLFYITCGAINVYQEYLFSVHMIGHMMLSMGVPVLLVPGAPVTLLLRSVQKRNDESRGMREWVLWAVHTPWARLVSHPIFAALNFATSLILFYFTPLFAWSVHDHLGHEWMTVHFLITGYLFAQALVGIDPGPHRLPYLIRLMLLVGTLAFHAFFGLALMDGDALLLSDWYGAMGRTWGEPPLQDQHTGGAIAWGIGELPTAVLTIIVSVQWARADSRESKRLDRASDRSGGADLEEYNAMLSRLAQRKDK